MDLVRLNQESRALVEGLADRLPPERLVEYRSLSDAGEWAELLDVLCAGLLKRHTPVSPAERDALAGLLGMFDAPGADYVFLGDPEKVLGGLTVT